MVSVFGVFLMTGKGPSAIGLICFDRDRYLCIVPVGRTPVCLRRAGLFKSGNGDCTPLRRDIVPFETPLWPIEPASLNVFP